MPVNVEEIINLLKTLADEEELIVCISESVKAGVLSLATTIIGGILGGPVGVMIGSSLGGVLYVTTHKKFKSVVQVIQEMDCRKKERLAQSVRDIMNNLDITDAVALAALISSDDSVKRKILGALVTHLQTELKYAVVKH